MSERQRAFVLRIAPGGVSRLEEALRESDLIIGWSNAEGLLDEKLDWEAFRQIVHDAYYPQDNNYNRSGKSAGNLSRFIKEMQIADLIVVPAERGFYIAQVEKAARFEPSKVSEDTAYRRKVKWLNGGRIIERSLARLSLRSRMNIRHTCADATDIIDDIMEVLQNLELGQNLTFDYELRKKLVAQTLKEIREGRIENNGFERLIVSLLYTLGAESVRKVPKILDKGLDVVADFKIAKKFRLRLGVQAKHWQPNPPVGKEVIEQLVGGLQAEEEATFGWVVTSGSYSPEAKEARNKAEEEHGYKIELIDGEELASLIVECGLSPDSTLIS